MPPQVLRPYQADARARIFAAWAGGAQRVLAVSPTGSGKTSIFASIASDLVKAGKRALVVVHRRELATQAAARFTEFGTDFGYVIAELPSKPYARMQIGSVQTLVRRSKPPADLVIFDEAHLSTAKTWQAVSDAYPRARVLGCTATPWRLSGKPLAGSYDACVVVATPAELREQGYLCTYVGFGYRSPDLSEVDSVGGEFNEKQTAAAMGASSIVDNAVEMYAQHARELSAVCFAVTVEHSRDLTTRFKAAGISAEHLDGGTPLEQRKVILKRVESGATRVLCNVGVAVEGLDIPRLKCCILQRPTMSLARHIQMLGRVRRPWNGVVARIHDHAQNIARHGLPDAEREYTLTAKQEKPPALHQCKQCFGFYDPPACSCGYERPPSEATERVVAIAENAEQFTFESGDEAEVTAPLRNGKPVEVRWDNAAEGRTYAGTLAKRWQEKTDYGPRWFYLLTGGKRDYKLPGAAHLDALMRKVQIPDSVFVTYLGMPNRRHAFKLEVEDAAV